MPRARRLLVSASFTIPIVLGSVIGYFGMRNAPDVARFALLAFTAGILLTVVIEEMVPEAHAVEHARFAALMLVCGFALFGLIATYLG